MANPQSENGHTDIANEILEALCKINLSAYQSRILNAIFRKTYGWNKKSDWISNSQLVELTGLKKQHVSRALSELKKRKMIIREGFNTSFQKDYEQWQELPKLVTVTDSGNSVTDLGNKVTSTGNGVTSTGAHKRNYTKEKKDICDSIESPEQLSLIPGPIKNKQCPQNEILKLWAQVLPDLPQPRIWKGNRPVLLRARWNEDKERQNLEWWESFFKFLRNSDFFMGKVHQPGRKPFVGRIDWLLKSENFMKTYEGNYHE